MTRLTLALMRQSLPRLVSAGIAILIGTAFTTITLLAGNVMTRTTNASLAAEYGNADLVVSADELTEENAATIRNTDGVTAADALSSITVRLGRGRTQILQYVIGTASDPALATLELSTGGYPQAPGEIALPPALAKLLHVHVGDQIEVTRPDIANDEPTERDESLTVVGLVKDPRNAYGTYGGAAVIDRGTLDTWKRHEVTNGALYAHDAAVALAPGARVDTVRASLKVAIPGASVRTPDELAEAKSRGVTNNHEVFVAAVLAFAAIAFVVAALVIANTFQVLVAHRAHTLALLRAVGASRRQLVRSVLLEASILGSVASLLGFAIGCGLGQLVLIVVARMNLDTPLPRTIQMSLVTALVPFLVGLVVTVVACTMPARTTARVTPLDALRPLEMRDGRRAAGPLRLIAFLIMTLGGFAVLAAGVALGHDGSSEKGLAVTVVGAAVSFTGLVLGGIFWIPALVALGGRLAGWTGPNGRLAAANTLRNPRRTAATSAALLIGVTLVATMSTGAMSARASSEAIMNARYSIDLWASALDGPVTAELPTDLIDEISELPGTAGVSLAQGALLTINGEPLWTLGLDPATVSEVTRDSAVLSAIPDGTIVMDSYTFHGLGLTEGETVTVTGPGGASAALTVTVGRGIDAIDATSATTLATLAPGAPVTDAMVRLDDDSLATAVDDVKKSAAGASVPVSIHGHAASRVYYDRIIDIIFRIVVGLLAVAVIIALIGVSNTLSLSVLERRRESATLRALGLTRRQLRRTIAIEGMLIAGVAAAGGSVLGIFYGWAGSVAALSAVGDVTLAVPWQSLAVVMAVALVAGWLASVLPARAATRTSPVASLGVE